MPTRALSTVLATLALLAGCSGSGSRAGDVARGSVTVCLGASELPDDPVAQDHVWAISGTVVSQSDDPGDEAFEVTDCFGDVQRVLVVEDAEGVTWTLGWAIEAEGVALAEALPLGPDDPVELEVVRQVVWGWDHGVVLHDGDGRLMLAAQEGMATDLNSAPEDPLGPVTVEVGEAYGPEARLPCGVAVNRTVVFTGEGPAVALEVGELGSVDTGSSVLTAVNAGAFSYEGTMNCTDTWGPTPWAMWEPSD